MANTEAVDSNAREAWSSIELTKGAKGTYQWSLKLYVPAGDEGGVVAKLRELDSQLRAEYGVKQEGAE